MMTHDRPRSGYGPSLAGGQSTGDHITSSVHQVANLLAAATTTIVRSINRQITLPARCSLGGVWRIVDQIALIWLHICNQISSRQLGFAARCWNYAILAPYRLGTVVLQRGLHALQCTLSVRSSVRPSVCLSVPVYAKDRETEFKNVGVLLQTILCGGLV